MDDCILHAVSSVIPVVYDIILFVVISVPTEIICWYLRSISVVLFMVHVPNCAMQTYNCTTISMKQLRVSLHDIGSETLHE